MRKCPYMLLVCLFFLSIVANRCAAMESDFIDVVIDRDSLSANTVQNYPLPNPDPDGQVSYRQASVSHRPKRGFTYPGGLAKPIVKCGPQMGPTPICMPMKPPGCTLPIRRQGQIELATQVFWATFSGIVRWPAAVNGVATSELDATQDLGLPVHNVLLEYSARCQFRPNWTLFYSVMPISMTGDSVLTKTVYYGGWVWGPGTHLRTKWNFLYQRAGIMYQPIVNCRATVSLFAGWIYNDQKARVNNGTCHLSQSRVDRTRNMVTGGLEIQRCIRTLCNGATLSSDCRGGVNFLDGAFGVDAQTSLRFSVPLGMNRWGYARGGYRYLSILEDRTDLRMDATFQGGFAELGMIF
jgi:hypothetical protein